MTLGKTMAAVHIFVSSGRFSSFEAIRAFIDPTYTQDGDRVASAFIAEVGISDFEPGCIEAFHAEEPRPLGVLLEGASWSDQWLPRLEIACHVDSAICVFEPNKISRPHAGSLQYCGALSFDPK